MKINKILFVSDDNINYLGFWKSISKFYKNVYDIEPHLFFIGNVDENNQKYLDKTYGQITIVKPIPNLPIIIQSLWGKFWFTQTEPETNWLIGDIDLYLLNKDYLQECLNHIPENTYSHLNANGYKLGDWWLNPMTGIPGYWHLAKGSIFKEYLELSDSFEEDCRFIYESKKYGILYNGLISNEKYAPNRVKDKKDYGFICCEEHLTTERLISLKDQINSFTYPSNLIRLETPFAQAGQKTPCDFKLKDIYHPDINYIDLHAPRPYQCFAQDVEDIIYDKL